MKTYPFAYFNSKIVPIEEATVSIACTSLQYGISCFTGMRGYVRGGKIALFRLRDHHERLMNASKIMHFGFSCSFEEFEKIVLELVRVNQPTSDFYIRPFIFSRNTEIAPKPVGLTFELAFYFTPMGRYYDPKQGLRLMISSWRKFSDAMLPTKAKAGGCYVNSYLATGEALQKNYSEALLMNQDGYIVEASVSNLIVVSRNRFLTPPVGIEQLEGITLRSAVELLRHEGVDVKETLLDRSMIYTADELMLTGTAAEIAFAESVDDRKVGSGLLGPHTLKLQNLFHTMIDGNHPFSKEWLTFI